MKSRNIECALELVWMQYKEMTNYDNKWEMEYLKDEAEKGIDAFGSACRILFGVKLEWALYQALVHARELNKCACSVFDFGQDEASKIAAVLTARKLACAAKVIYRIQCQQECSLIVQSRRLCNSICYYSNKFRKKIDPDGVLYLKEP